MKPEAELESLKIVIRQHEKAYYAARPTISDREFDTLMARLQALEDNHPDLVTEDSPTQVIYYDENN